MWVSFILHIIRNSDHKVIIVFRLKKFFLFWILFRVEHIFQVNFDMQCDIKLHIFFCFFNFLQNFYSLDLFFIFLLFIVISGWKRLFWKVHKNKILNVYECVCVRVCKYIRRWFFFFKYIIFSFLSLHKQ